MPTARKTLPAVDAFAPEINIGRQDAIAELFSKIGDHKVRAIVRSDSYDFQCYARIYVWRPDKLDWSLVHSIHYKAMKTPEGLAYGGRAVPTAFRADMDELLRVAKEILL